MDPADDARTGEAPVPLSTLLRLSLFRSPVGFALIDEDLRYLVVNEALARINGMPIEAHLSRTITDLMPPEVANSSRALLHEVLHTQAPALDIEFSGPNFRGEHVSVVASWYPVITEDFRGVGVVVHDVTSRVAADQRQRRSEQRYRSLVSAIAEVVFIADADGTIREDSPSWRSLTGQSPEEYVGLGWLNALHPDDRDRVHAAWEEATRSGTPYEVEYRVKDRDGRYRLVLARGYPVVLDGAVSEWVGCLIDVSRLRAVEQDRDELAALLAWAAERQNALQSLAAGLSVSLTVDEVTRLAVQLAPPILGACGAMVVLCDADRQVRLAAAREVPESLGTRWRVFPLDAAIPAVRAAATGRPLLLDDPAAWRSTFPDPPPGATDDPPTGAVDSYPVMSGSEVLGAVTFTFAGPRPETPEQRALAVEVVEVIGQAIARSQHYEHEHSIAANLQRRMLPRSLPRLLGAEVGATYRPGSHDAEVGGDWFEVLRRDDGSVLLAVGDVMGKGLPAASVMSDFRLALRAYSVLTGEPSELLQLLARYQRSQLSDPEQLVTLGLARFDPASRRVVWASAGHLPPVLVRGTDVTWLDTAQGLPLGLADDWESAEVTLATDDLFLLFSDGLVEDRRRRIDDGLEELERVLAELAGLSPSQLCDRLVERLSPSPTRDDDITLLALKVPAPDWDGAHWLPAAIDSVPRARQLARQELEHLGVTDPATVEQALILVSELVTNAVRHAASGVGLLISRVDRTLRVEVSDEDPTSAIRPQPLDVHAPSGRGLLLVEALSQKWGVDATHQGKTVWAELEVRGAPGLDDDESSSWPGHGVGSSA